jgi:hypothetical protein
MIGLFGPIKVEVLESELPCLKVRPQRKLSRAAQIVTARVGEKSFRIKVRPVERDCDATWVEIVDSLGSHDALVRSLAELEERRVAHREKAALAVRSPDLPNFRATTVDISETGLRLSTAGPVAVGIRVRLEIDPRGPTNRTTDLSGVTVWSQRRAENDYQVGVRVLGRVDIQNPAISCFLAPL